MVDFAKELSERDKLPQIWSMFKHLHVDEEQNSMTAKMVDQSESMTESDASSDVSPIRKVLKKRIEKGIAHSISLLKSEQR